MEPSDMQTVCSRGNEELRSDAHEILLTYKHCAPAVVKFQIVLRSQKRVLWIVCIGHAHDR